jgi:ATP-binding cassette subfamily E protein 1
MIRSMLTPNNYVICVEHDLSILDYLSDYISCLYGEPGGYGVVTMPFSVREGINIFLAGFVPTENMRFRDEELTFKVRHSDEEKKQTLAGQDPKELAKRAHYSYPAMVITLNKFVLTVEPGTFMQSEIVVMLGQNGTGKTTLIKMLAGILKPDDKDIDMPRLNISYKPQTIAPKF